MNNFNGWSCKIGQDHLFIDPNGWIKPGNCDQGAILGNVKDQKIIDIWCNKKFTSARKNLLNKRRGNHFRTFPRKYYFLTKGYDDDLIFVYKETDKEGITYVGQIQVLNL